MFMISAKDQARDRRLSDLVQLGHKFREKRLAPLVEQGPPGFFAVFRMHNLNAVRTCDGQVDAQISPFLALFPASCFARGSLLRPPA